MYILVEYCVTMADNMTKYRTILKKIYFRIYMGRNYLFHMCKCFLSP